MASSTWRRLLPIALRIVPAATLPAALLAVASLALAPAGSAAEQGFVRLGYAGYLGNVQMIEASIGLEAPAADDGHYRMALDVAMSGNMAKLVPFSMTAESVGRAAGGAVHPSRYSSMTRIYDDAQSMRLSYGAGGAVEIAADPPTVEAREARERDLAQGTLDPLSAVVALVDTAARTGACGGRVAVFDGTRRYDLEATPAGTGQVTRIGVSLYQGPAIECTIRPIFIDGFRQSDVDAGLYPDSATMWIAPVVAGEPPVPVRVTGRSALGTLRLDLVEAWAMDGSPLTACADGGTVGC